MLPDSFIQALKDGKVLFTTLVEMDKIIRVITGSVLIPASSPFTEAQELDAGFEGSVFYRGVFSVDDGDTWNDVAGNALFGGDIVALSVRSSDGKIHVRTYSESASPVTALYKIACIYHPQITDVNTDFLEFDAPVSISTERNYQKIYREGIEPFSLTGSTSDSISIPHNLGYNPEFMLYIATKDGPSVTDMIDGRGAFDRVLVSVDNENIKIVVNSSGLTPQDVDVYWRFYYEHA